MLLFALACAKPVPPPDVSAAAGVPHLPSPRGDLYTRHTDVPSDPLVAQVVGAQPWEEVLSGVAAGVALARAEGHAPDPYQLRWHAVKAGYPYPVGSMLVAVAPQGEVPAGFADAVRQVNGGDLGVARARGKDGDWWVLLQGRPRGQVPVVAREHPVGATIPAGGLVVSDPLGQIRPAADTLTLDMKGEWLIQARDAAGGFATLPLYVGEETPEEPPVVPLAPAADDEAGARALLDDVWGWYGRAAPAFDPGLDAVARARLRDLLAGRTLPDPARQVGAAGFVGVPAAAATCRAADATACLDGVWWSPERRGVLVGGFEALGVAAARDHGDLVLVVVAAG